MDTNDIFIVLGTLATGERLCLWQSDRRRHLYLVGATGTGKTTLLRHLMLSDLGAGAGFALIDPHGDIATEIADSIPNEQTGRVVYFDLADLSHPIGFNPVESVPADQQHLRAVHIVATFKHLWSESWGPRLSYILENAIRLLIDAPGATLLGLPRLLVDSRYREQLLRHCDDPIVRQFWRLEFDNYPDRFRAEAISPIQNKIGALLGSPAIRNILGQPKSTIDIPAIMDGGRILIVNLSKGRIGEEPAHLLGAFLTTAIAQAAEGRAVMPEEDRRDFTLYADEFQNFATESFASILSEARKYRLSLVLAHQFLGQLPPSLRQAVMGNVGTILAFRVGAEDAPYIADELGLNNARTLTETRNFRAWGKTLYNGLPTDPRWLEMPEPEFTRRNSLAAVKARTAARHARERAGVEERIGRFLNSTY